MTVAPFVAHDFAWRMRRGAQQAGEAGLSGVLVTPGPDLLYFAGYMPIAITERITMLVIPVSGDPTMIVPKLERPDAENAPGVTGLQLVDWADGSDPYRATARLLDGNGRYAISDSAWAICQPNCSLSYSSDLTADSSFWSAVYRRSASERCWRSRVTSRPERSSPHRSF